MQVKTKYTLSIRVRRCLATHVLNASVSYYILPIINLHDQSLKNRRFGHVIREQLAVTKNMLE